MEILFFIQVLLTSLVSLSTKSQAFQESFRNKPHGNNCTLNLDFESQTNLSKLIRDEKKLIEMHINVQWKTTPPNVNFPRNVIWFLTTDERGKRMLLLDKNFEIMSLGTLSYSVANTIVRVKQEPRDCLKNKTDYIALNLLKWQLLTLQSGTTIKKDEGNFGFQVCTSRNVCCQLLSLNRHIIKCREISDDIWIELYSYVILTLMLVAVSYSVKLIPRFFYAETAEVFELDRCFKIEVELPDEKPNWVKFWNKHNRDINNDVRGKTSVIFKTESIEVDIEGDMLFSEVEGNTGLSDRLRRFGRFLCNVCRRYNKPPKTQLHGMFGSFMKFFAYLVCWSPLIIRWLFTFKYNDFTIYSMFEFSTGRYFFVYIAILISVYILFFLKCETSWLNVIVKDTLQLVNELIPKDIFTKARENKIIPPDKDMSLYSYIKYSPIFLGIGLFSLAIVCCPILPFLIVLVPKAWKLATDDHTENKLNTFCTKLGKVFAVIVLEFVFLGVFLILFDGVYFYSVCVVYIILGFIINFEFIMPFVTFILLICSYTYSCLNDVQLKIDKFNGKVIKRIETTNKDFIKEFYQRARSTRNKNKFAFVNNRSKIVLRIIGNKLVLSPKCLVLFYKYNKANTSKTQLPFLHISKTFLEQIHSYDPESVTPGSIYSLYFRAFKEISVMFFLLFFVLLGLLSFGGVSQLSSGLQTLITLESGVVLFIFNRILFRSSNNVIHDNELHLDTIINEALNDNEAELEIRTETLVRSAPDEGASVRHIYNVEYLDGESSNSTSSAFCFGCCRRPNEGTSDPHIYNVEYIDNELSNFNCCRRSRCANGYEPIN